MNNYSFLDRILHRAALQSRSVAEMSFDLDQLRCGKNLQDVRSCEHVFISGLARAGTTILLRNLYESDHFCTLSYRNMPFVLAPNIWEQISGYFAKDFAAVERAHGDRIIVNADSPEAFDEVFWRVFDCENYISENSIKPHEPDEQLAAKFALYVAAIVNADRKHRSRYLSKNNNNIIRLKTIRRLFPNAHILIPLRQPLAHAQSLQRQHENFSSLQRSSPFTRSYMGWLGHHEFGLDHKPFRIGCDIQSLPIANDDPANLTYWLQLWCNTYGWLEKSAPADAIFVCYEKMCEDPEVWSRLSRLCSIDADSREKEPFVLETRNCEAPNSPELMKTASAIYHRLSERAQARLDGPAV